MLPTGWFSGKRDLHVLYGLVFKQSAITMASMFGFQENAIFMTPMV
jgi:hypothetical protein